MVTWTTRDMAKTLRITVAEVNSVIPVLTMQGYVKPTGEKGEWMTTMAGENVSGSSTPNLTRESVEGELSALAERMKDANRKIKSPFKVKTAVAFGDFLSGRHRVQPAEVGVLLQPSGDQDGTRPAGATVRAKELAFLKNLRGKSREAHLCLYADWMGRRTHRKLV